MEAGATQNGDRIELIDDKILNNEEFKKNVAICTWFFINQLQLEYNISSEKRMWRSHSNGYFKDIFKDLVAQS